MKITSYTTAAEQAKRDAKIIAKAQEWLARGFSREDIGNQLWNVYAVAWNVKDGQLVISRYTGKATKTVVIATI